MPPKTRDRIEKSTVRQVAALCLLLLTGCDEPVSTSKAVSGGDPERGQRVIKSVGCGACHSIPGIPGADAAVGPPLDVMSRQAYIAGVLPNTSENLVRWLKDPPSVDPRTAMPDLGVTDKQARDIAAYLYSLGEGPQ